jgi:gamma-glutamylputrescine oxidase
VHSGHRRDQDWLERAVGDGYAHALWRLAEDARNDLLALIQRHAIACDFKPGVIHVRSVRGQAAEDAAHVARMASRYRYDQLELVSREALAEELGTDVYEGGVIDHGGGHLHPLNLALGLAQTALSKGAVIHEQSQVLAWSRVGRRIVVAADKGQVTCDQLILTGDGYIENLSPVLEARVAPINNFIAVTEPLDEGLGVLTEDRAVADDRFVVNYFRKTADGRLLFGGGETYTKGFPDDIAGLVRGHILKVYPQLEAARIDYAWGGTLGITLSRAPFVGEVAPGVWAAAGYSGQGVALAPYFGKLLAQAALGERAGVELLARLPTPTFPGGRLLRGPITTLGLSWYRLRDRLGWTG